MGHGCESCRLGVLRVLPRAPRFRSVERRVRLGRRGRRSHRQHSAAFDAWPGRQGSPRTRLRNTAQRRGVLARVWARVRDLLLPRRQAPSLPRGPVARRAAPWDGEARGQRRPQGLRPVNVRHLRACRLLPGMPHAHCRRARQLLPRRARHTCRRRRACKLLPGARHIQRRRARQLLLRRARPGCRRQLVRRLLPGAPREHGRRARQLLLGSVRQRLLPEAWRACRRLLLGACRA
mmetsp:Transcript_113363/g.327399  ORF Transcript_113363/g.327399 Transcript_113363/m.327399 type:complete len:235 (+) Transcript_113363:248-952(+)